VARWIAASLLVALACTSPERDVQKYIAAREAHQKVFDSVAKKSYDEALKLNAAWVRAHEADLRRIVGPFSMAGLTDSVKMHIGSASGPYDFTTSTEGFVYYTTDSIEVFVSDTAFVRAWSGERSNDPKSHTIEGLMADPLQYVGMFSVEAAPMLCAKIPIQSAKHVLSAMAIEYSQDRMPGECRTNSIAVSILLGHRIIAAQRELIPDSIAADPKRVAAMAQSFVDRLPDR
jgi:hypothetical protein